MNNSQFDYKVSIIIPIYNSEEYIANTLNSLVNQIFDIDEMEVLMIDDGSVDRSAEICKKYAEKYSNFKLYQKENGGVSKARNFGIDKAQGKYIMYLDADDTYSCETVKNVVAFFDEHYNEIDIVTFNLVRYTLPDNEKMSAHMRYAIMRETGIYDLTKDENIFIVQTTMNICIKNRFAENKHFDETMISAEDQKYITTNLLDKMKIGYCREASYNYYKHKGSATSEKLYPQFAYEPEMKYYEWLFSLFEDGQIPKYIQALVFYNMIWKNNSNLLYPWHLEGEEYKKEYSRLIKLLNKIDTDVIVAHPTLNNFHKQYFLCLKENNPVYPFVSKRGVFLINSDNSNVTYFCKKIEIVIKRIRIKDNQFVFLGHIKSPLFNYLGKPTVVAYENGKKVDNDIDLFLSSFSYYGCKTKTNNFWAFYYTTPVDSKKSIEFFVNIDGMDCITKLKASVHNPFYDNMFSQYFIANTEIKLDDNKICIAPLTNEEFWAERDSVNKKYIKDIRIFNHRESCKKYSNRRIWLYSDCYTVDYDNGYYQFLNDWNKQDGVERYYIITKDFSEVRAQFSPEMYNQLILFGSTQHKDLYINAEKILTSYSEYPSINPFTDKDEENDYIDLLNFEVIYLQHGVLHAKLPWYYSPESRLAEKVVISSPFEKENFIKNYGWHADQLIECGMPRYDYIDRNAPAKNKIIFAPSWRSYLIGDLAVNESKPQRDACIAKLKSSNYYKNITEFLNSTKLHKLLDDNDLYLDVKLHPNFYEPYRQTVTINSDRVNITNNKVDLSDYKMFLTDFSSFVFDYAYLNRPVHYFVPDYTEFISGMNHYRELDMPYDEAFGTLSKDPQGAVDAIEKAINNGFEVEEPFKDRMENFYYPLENCCEDLYQYLMSENKEEK